MAEYGLVSKTLTLTNNSSSYTATGSFYFDVTITDSDTSVALTITPKQRLVYTPTSSIGDDLRSCFCRFDSRDEYGSSSSSAYWNLYNNTTASTLISSTSISIHTENSSTASPVIQNAGSSKSVTINKTYTAQNLSFFINGRLEAELRAGGYTSVASSSYITDSTYVSWGGTAATLTITPKTSYTITYNANGGSGAPASQTKWYGENLTLQTGAPSKDGYTFKGWATSTTNASAGTVNYAAGASYTANSAATLYAVWELNHISPTISNIKVERCLSDGTLDDEGTYAKVSFNWTVFRSSLTRYYGGSTTPYSSNRVNSSSGCIITVGEKTKTVTSSNASGTFSEVIGDGSFNTDSAYSTSISLKDAPASPITATTITITGNQLPKAAFPMDFNANATAVGFFMPAPDNGNGAYFGRDIFIPQTVNIKKDTINASLANNNLSSATYPGVIIQDAAGRMLAKLEGVINATGEIGIALHSKNYNTSGTAFSTSAAFLSTIDKSGTQVTSLRGNTINIGNSSTSTVNVKGQALADFIVAQGTSGIWYYRKWNSGVAECWGLQAKSLTMVSGYGTDEYYTSSSETFPSGLFKSGTQPIVLINRQGQEGAGLVSVSVYSVSNTTVQYFVFNSGAVYNPAPIGLAIHVFGLWK